MAPGENEFDTPVLEKAQVWRLKAPFEFYPHHVLLICPCAGCFTSLNLSFFTSTVSSYEKVSVEIVCASDSLENKVLSLSYINQLCLLKG